MNSLIEVLIVDDEVDICDLVSGILDDNGYRTRSALSYVDAFEAIESHVPQLVILDVWLGNGDRDGLRLLHHIKSNYPSVSVIMMSGHSTISTAVEAIKNGACDFIEKPFDSARLLVSVEKAVNLSKLQDENSALKAKAKITNFVVGTSQAVVKINEQIADLATQSTRCAIIGPKGSDKENIARAIHENSARFQSPFFVLNCAQNSVTQIETELFGSEITLEECKTVNRGLFERAHGGTIFMDNIDALPPKTQSSLYTALSRGVFRRIGGDLKDFRPLNARIISGFSQDIEQTIAQKQFLETLYILLSPVKINIPPLPYRSQDIPILFLYYLNQAASLNGWPLFTISTDAMQVLRTYDWPGDVEELKSTIDWVMANATSKDGGVNILKLADLPPRITGLKSEGSEEESKLALLASVDELNLKKARAAFEREYFKRLLGKCSGSANLMSQASGMDRSAVYRKLKSLGLGDYFKYK